MIQKLNLSSPDPNSELQQRTSALPGIAFDLALRQPDPAGVQFVTEMAVKLAAGPKPEWLYVCGQDEGFFMFKANAEDKPVVLLFMTPFAALDYIVTTKANAQVRQIKFDSVPDRAKKWIELGIPGGVALNRCPRCPIFLSIPLPALTKMETLLQVWATRRATQLYFGQRTVREFLGNQDSAARIVALEQIRDHIDCGIPYVYELLGFLGRLQGNASVQSAALEQLQKFGPPFADWETRWDPSSTGMQRIAAEAYVGLGRSFGIQINAQLK